MGGTFSLITSLVRQNANGYIQTQAIWMGNSVMEIVTGYAFSEPDEGEDIGIDDDENGDDHDDNNDEDDINSCVPSSLESEWFWLPRATDGI